MNLFKISLILVAIVIVIEGKEITTYLSSVKNFLGRTISIPAVDIRFLKGDLGVEDGVFDIIIIPDSPYFSDMETTVDSSHSKVTMCKVMRSVKITGRDNRPMNFNYVDFKIPQFVIKFYDVIIQYEYNHTKDEMQFLNVTIKSITCHNYSIEPIVYKSPSSLGRPALRTSEDILNQIVPVIESKMKNILSAVSPKKFLHSFYPAIGKQGIVELDVSAIWDQIYDQMKSIEKLFSSLDPNEHAYDIKVGLSRIMRSTEGTFERIFILGSRHHIPKINFRHDILNNRATMNLWFDEITVEGEYYIWDDSIRNLMESPSNTHLVKITYKNIKIQSDFSISNNNVIFQGLEIINDNFKIFMDKPLRSEYELCDYAKNKLVSLRFCTFDFLKGVLPHALKITINKWLEKFSRRTLQEIQQRFDSLYWK